MLNENRIKPLKIKTKKIKSYRETHQEGYLSIEQNLLVGMKNCDFGIQVATDGRIWICINGVSLLRFKPKMNEYEWTERERRNNDR